MSRILNRPMFRGGGKVSSYGTGIASGLADGGMADKRGLVDGPGGYAGLKDINKFNNYEEFQDYNKFINANEKILSNQEIDTQVEEGKFANRPWYDLTGILDLGMGITGPSSDFIQGLQYEKTAPGQQEYRTELETNRDNLIRQSQKYGVNIPEGISLTKPEVEGGKSNELSIEESIAKMQAAERAKYQEMIDMAMGTKKSSKEKIAENKKIFEEALGGGKSARIADASDMALSFAGKAFKEGATTKSAFGEFFEEESKRPSRRLKVKDAATQAAIQSYLTGKVSYQKFQDDLALTKAGLDMKAEAIRPKNLNQAFAKFIKTNDKATDPGIMSDAVEEIYGIDSFAGPLPEDTTKLIIGKVYYGDAQDKSSNKILYLIDETGTPNPIKTVYR
jgi:hypothetical protein